MIYGYFCILDIYIYRRIFFNTNYNDEQDGNDQKENEGQEVY